MIDPNILPQLTYQLFNNKDYKLLSTNRGIKNDDDLNLGKMQCGEEESDEDMSVGLLIEENTPGKAP